MSYSRDEKAMWLDDWKQSGKKPWTYAKKNGLIPQTFCKWVKQETQKTSGFVEVPLQVKSREEHPQEILVEKGDAKIYIPVSVWIECPAGIMEVLRALI